MSGTSHPDCIVFEYLHSESTDRAEVHVLGWMLIIVSHLFFDPSLLLLLCLVYLHITIIIIHVLLSTHPKTVQPKPTLLNTIYIFYFVSFFSYQIMAI